jgi:ParB family transcriptional regulator, chromosome partitioning protein
MKRIRKMKIIQVDINEIIPYVNNPRKNEKAVDYVASSIKEFGWQQPIVVDKDNVIVVGHTRYLAAKRLKLKKVPILVAENLTPFQIKAYRIADNKTNEIAEWDYELLSTELAAIINQVENNFDIDSLGFNRDELDSILNTINIDEYMDEENNEKKNEKENKITCPECGFEFVLGS